ncbi:MAG: cardiolipin synthase [Thermoleophilia bacterium]|nr:cardiolipin synthase [Thermoleophilia bacterium]
MHAARSITTLPSAASTVTPDAPPVHTPTVPGAPGDPIAGGVNWSLWDETNAVPAIVAAIDGARTVVDAEYFQITGAGKGASVTAALIRAARRGVEVNVIADLMSRVTPPFGSFDAFRRDLVAAGGHVHVTTVVDLPWSGPDAEGRAYVDHRKVVAIDGTAGFVGGMNLARMTDAYHDSMLQLAGVDAARLGVEELDRWRRVGGTVSAAHHDAVYGALGTAPLVPTDPKAMRIVVNAPEQQRTELTRTYVDAIRNAKQRIWISSPAYTSQGLIDELKAAVRRGVDVQFIAAGAPPAGLPLINWISQSHLASLIALGAHATIIP